MGYSRPYYRIRIFNGTDYKTLINVIESDIIESTYTNEIFPNYDKLTLKLKLKSQFVDLVPRNKADLKQPIIFEKCVVDMTTRLESCLYSSFIIAREVRRTENDRSVLLYGVGFDYFKHNKLIASNSNNVGSDPNNLPSDFAKYNATTTLKNHLDYFYDTAILNPKALTWGILASVPILYRKIKGLNSITVSTLVTGSKTIQIEQVTINEAEAKAFELFDTLLVTRHLINANGLIDVTVSDPIEVTNDLIRSTTQVLEEYYSFDSKTNYVFGHGEPDNASNQYELKQIDFTTLEKLEDFSFVSGTNQTYLDNTTLTSLRTSLNEQFREFLKVNIINPLIDFKAGDIIKLNGNQYIVRLIQESNRLNQLTYDFEIERR